VYKVILAGFPPASGLKTAMPVAGVDTGLARNYSSSTTNHHQCQKVQNRCFKDSNASTHPHIEYHDVVSSAMGLTSSSTHEKEGDIPGSYGLQYETAM
jgi:hypothetical protein